MAIDDNAKDLIRQLAIADTTIKGLVKNRVFPKELPEIKVPTFPTINFDIASNRGVERSPNFRIMTMVIWAYSNDSYEEAKDVYNAFFNLFNAERFNNADVNIVMDEAEGPIQFFDNKHKLFFYRSRWNLRASKR